MTIVTLKPSLLSDKWLIRHISLTYKDPKLDFWHIAMQAQPRCISSDTLGRSRHGWTQKGLANILSFHKVEKHYKIKYDTKSMEGVFVVDTVHKIMIFQMKEMSLPYTKINTVIKPLCLIAAVRENFDRHTKKEIINAEKSQGSSCKRRQPHQAQICRNGMSQHDCQLPDHSPRCH